jgi:hypothetical protein
MCRKKHDVVVVRHVVGIQSAGSRCVVCAVSYVWERNMPEQPRTRFDISYDAAKQCLIIKCNYPKLEKNASNRSKIFFGHRAITRYQRIVETYKTEGGDGMEKLIIEEYKIGDKTMTTAQLGMILFPTVADQVIAKLGSVEIA